MSFLNGLVYFIDVVLVMELLLIALRNGVDEAQRFLTFYLI
jgi:hypothetical protein